ALGTFTAVPVTPPGRTDGRVAGTAMLLAPLTALPALAAWAVLALLAVTGLLPPAVAGALALVATALLSRAMHLDGLADTADGLTAGYDRERALTVMRRGDTGPAGAAALVLTLLVQAACLASLFSSSLGATLAGVALLASRLAPAICARTGVPAARAEGLGATVAGSVQPRDAAALVAVLAGLGALVTWWVASRTGAEPPSAAGALAVVAGGVAASRTVVRRATQRLGGVTGDVFGAAVEISLAAALVVATAAYAIATR
ncbi:MAG: cobalamin-5-phosphate synthase CobS, partial [Humibacillus sp.]|nr:cobalamin-5-phosphate synthase CobS [Humibacillus sp.]